MVVVERLKRRFDYEDAQMLEKQLAKVKRRARRLNANFEFNFGQVAKADVKITMIKPARSFYFNADSSLLNQIKDGFDNEIKNHQTFKSEFESIEQSSAYVNSNTLNVEYTATLKKKQTSNFNFAEFLTVLLKMLASVLSKIYTAIMQILSRIWQVVIDALKKLAIKLWTALKDNLGNILKNTDGSAEKEVNGEVKIGDKTETKGLGTTATILIGAVIGLFIVYKFVLQK
jgi:tetrahydromethanopterin S-methyltransferase subunit G